MNRATEKRKGRDEEGRRARKRKKPTEENSVFYSPLHLKAPEGIDGRQHAVRVPLPREIAHNLEHVRRLDVRVLGVEGG